MKGRDRVLKRSGSPSGSARKPRQLNDAMFDQARLSTQTYLTLPELCAYLRFVDHATGALKVKAAYHWLDRTPIRKCGRGRTIEVLRRDVDDAIQRVHDGRAYRSVRAAV